MSRKKLAIDKKSFTPLGGRIDTLLSMLNLTATRFAKSLNITEAYLSRLMRSRGKGGDKLWRGIKRLYPAWEPFLRGEIPDPPIKPYAQAEEHMLPHKNREAPDSGPDQIRTPNDLTNYRVVKVLASEEGHRRELHAKLDQILNSGDQSLILAITCNIEEFEKAAKDRRTLAHGKEPPTALRRDGIPEQLSPSSKEPQHER